LPVLCLAPLMSIALAGCASPAVPFQTTQGTATSPPMPASIEPATPSPSVAPTRTLLPPPVSPEFPTGTYYHQHPEGYYCIYRFNPDGTMAYYWLAWSLDLAGLKPFSTGTYQTDGSRLTFTSTDLPGCNVPATYQWTYDGLNLGLQAIVQDPCSDRQRIYEKGMIGLDTE
jgi:hypothetical protein